VGHHTRGIVVLRFSLLQIVITAQRLFIRSGLSGKDWKSSCISETWTANANAGLEVIAEYQA
jgi:hypothetical protein